MIPFRNRNKFDKVKWEADRERESRMQLQIDLRKALRQSENWKVREADSDKQRRMLVSVEMINDEKAREKE